VASCWSCCAVLVYTELSCCLSSVFAAVVEDMAFRERCWLMVEEKKGREWMSMNCKKYLHPHLGIYTYLCAARDNGLLFAVCHVYM